MGLGTDPVSVTGTEVDRLVEEATAWRYRDADRSSALLDQAEAAMDGRRDLGRAAQIGELRGDLALAQGHLGDAATAYRLARRNWLAVGRRLEAIRATLRYTSVQVLLGEFEEAEVAVLRIQAQLGRETHEDGRMARLDAAVQLLLADARAGMGDIATAVRHYDTAENLFVALGDEGGLALVNVRRGLTALDAGLAHNALREFNRARAANMSAGLERVGAIVAVLTAEALAATGQVSRALEVLDCVEPDMRGNRWLVGVHRLARSNALLRAGLPAEAITDARAAEELFAKIGAVDYSARAELSCARASLRLERTNAAATELAGAERLFAECSSHLMRAFTWLAQAKLALSVEDQDAARARCQRVLAAELDDTAPYLGVQARLTLARVEDAATASDLLATAAELAARTGVPELRVDVLVARARHERRLGDSDAAIELLRSALGVGHAWSRQLGERGAGAVLAPVTEATEELIALLLERNDHAGRVEAWRRARAVKRQSLVPLGTRGAAPATSELRLQRLEELLGDTPPSGSVGGSDREEPLPSVPWQSMVEYCVSGEDVVAFVLRDGQVDARVLRDTAGETQRMVRAWQQECRLMAPGLRVESALDASSPALDGLYEMLLAPIADLLADLDDELTVLAHRHLDAVPFEALLDDVGPWAARLGLTASEVVRATEQNGSGPVAALVLAVPDENAPLITAEAEMIFRALPSAEIVVGADATKEALVRHARSADVVHLACHGVFRQDDPLSSALRLGDGWLQARDIVNGSLGFEGSVVVLSACGSGLSPDYVSEPIGLASACLAAGATGVIAALWTVDDAVTLELMTFFYRALADGWDARSALREARRQVARDHPHPYYWAAFRYVSDPDGH